MSIGMKLCKKKCEGLMSFPSHLQGHGYNTTIPTLSCLKATIDDDGCEIALL
jgi:hypothetical protein